MLEPDLATVNQLRFSKTVYDNYLRFQLMIRYTNDCILAVRLLKGGSLNRTITLPFKAFIQEIVFAAYTVNYNPITSGVGNVFTVEIEAL